MALLRSVRIYINIQTVRNSDTFQQSQRSVKTHVSWNISSTENTPFRRGADIGSEFVRYLSEFLM